MGDTFDWWLQGGDWYDRKQQRAIQDLERSNARARSQTRSLQKRVEENQASLTRRVDRLERALRAVVELEDIREELNEHVPAALVRRHARSVVMKASGLADGGAAPWPEPPADVPGYWLAPAARWADAIGESPANSEMLQEAYRRDPVRTDLFVVALSSMIGRPVAGSDDLERLVARELQVTDWQREVWLATAQRRFGDEARDALIDRLRQVADGVSRDRLGVVLPQAIRAGGPTESGRRLAALADHIAPDAPASHASGSDRLAELLAVIVDEGAPGEVAVLDSMVDIRRVLADDAAVQPPDRRVVDEVVGEPLALLLGDLGGSDRDLRELAVDVFGPDLLAAAEDLHAVAANAPAPVTMVDVFGHGVQISGAVPTESDWVEHVEAAHPVESPPTVPPFGVVGVLVLLAGLLLVPLAGSVGVLVALVGAAVAGWFAWSHVRQREVAQRSIARREAARRRSQRQIEEAARRIAAESADLDAARSGIDESLDRVVARVRSLATS